MRTLREDVEHQNGYKGGRVKKWTLRDVKRTLKAQT